MQSTFFPNKGKSLEQAVAIRVVGNTAPTGGIADGKYVFLKGHSTLPDGGYKANGAIQAGATLTSSNLTATSDGFVNDAYSALSSDLGSPSSASGVTGNDAFSKISTLNGKITKETFSLSAYQNRVTDISTTKKTIGLKSANTIVIIINAKILTNLPTYTSLLIIPSNYIPTGNIEVSFPVVINKNGTKSVCDGVINFSNGNVNINHNGLSVDDEVYANFSYVI